VIAIVGEGGVAVQENRSIRVTTRVFNLKQKTFHLKPVSQAVKQLVMPSEIVVAIIMVVAIVLGA
jgi:hypothetical protein